MAWSGWEEVHLDGSLPGPIAAAVQDGQGSIDLFGIGAAFDEHVYTAGRRGNVWSGWGRIGDAVFDFATTLTIGAVQDSQGSIDLFAVGQDGRPYTAWRRDNAWSGWATVAHGVFGEGTQIAAVQDRQGSIDLFAIGQDGRPSTAWRRDNAWSGWATVANGVFAQVTPIAAVQDSQGSIDLFAVGQDGRPYTAWRRGNAWSGWATVANGNYFDQETRITAFEDSQGSINLVAHGDAQGEQVYTAWRRGNVWSGWDKVSDPDPTKFMGWNCVAVQDSQGSIDLFELSTAPRVYTASGTP